MNNRSISIWIIWVIVIGGFFGIVNFGSEEAKAEIWYVETVDSAGDVGADNSIALDNRSHPHISYFDNTSKALKYAMWTGNEWNIETVDNAGDVGIFSSIAIDNCGRPHISYYDMDNTNLKYAKWTGTYWVIETVDSAGDVGHFSSVVLDSIDNAHISYYDNTSYDLKYAKWTGSSWKIETVDFEEDVGQYTSIVVDSNDNPHISYIDNKSWDIKYAKCTDSVWTIKTVDSPKYHGYSTSIALDSNGYPHISYFDLEVPAFGMYIYYQLKYAKWTGSSWSYDYVTSTKFGGFTSIIALDSNDIPHICYCYCDPYGESYEITDLNYARWDGYTWNIEPVNSSGDIGYFISMAIDANDYPHISYNDPTNETLKYVTTQKPPYKPNIPSGPLNGEIGISYSYSVSATDPNGDQIKYIFDWGDGTTYETEYVDSGTTETGTHNWTFEGSYNITARAIDIHEESSEWSDNLTVVISKKDVSKDDDFLTFFLFGIIGAIIAASLVSVFMLNKRSKKSKISAQQYSYAQQQYIQQYPQQPIQPAPVQPQYSQTQTQTVPVSCPNCRYAFYVRAGLGPHRIQCPNCGISGIMKI